jgi:hypothetical protein
MTKSFYETLEVSPRATQETIKAAYKSLVQRHHPDRHGGSAEAAQRTRELNVAYRVLSDPKLRRHYDGRLAAKAMNQQGAGQGSAPTTRNAARCSASPQASVAAQDANPSTKSKPGLGAAMICAVLFWLMLGYSILRHTGVAHSDPQVPRISETSQVTAFNVALNAQAASSPAPGFDAHIPGAVDHLECLPAESNNISHTVTCGDSTIRAAQAYTSAESVGPERAFSIDENVTMELGCQKYEFGGDVRRYRTCMAGARTKASVLGPLPDYSDLPSGEAVAIQMACSGHQLSGNISRYQLCIRRQLQSIGR